MKREFTAANPEFQAALQRMHAEAQDNRAKGHCPQCHQAVTEDDFRDLLSRREWKISGLCQKCQDGLWGNPETGEKGLLETMEEKL